jgi:DNA-binding response OmpR family regulator
MTAFGSEEMRREAYQKGARYYYTKPIDIEELMRCVSDLGIPVKR